MILRIIFIFIIYKLLLTFVNLMKNFTLSGLKQVFPRMGCWQERPKSLILLVGCIGGRTCGPLIKRSVEAVRSILAKLRVSWCLDWMRRFRGCHHVAFMWKPNRINGLRRRSGHGMSHKAVGCQLSLYIEMKAENQTNLLACGELTRWSLAAKSQPKWMWFSMSRLDVRFHLYR